MKHDAVGCFVFVFFALYVGGMKMCDEISSNNREEELYQKAILENTHTEYLEYLNKFPNGRYYDEIRKKDDAECWKMVLSEPSIKKYKWYLHLHPRGEYQEQAQVAINQLEYQSSKNWKIESKAWELAVEGEEYDKYLSLYPEGKYAVEAEKRIVELGIKRIMQGEYSSLPMMQSSSVNTTNNKAVSLIRISNQTSFNLTIYHSGIDSKRVKLAPRQSSTITLKKGNYNIAAMVDAPNVSKYAGSQYLSNDEYTVSYYIETKRY